jgi:DNA-binding winged helix-turn-helix (wHTH) protein
VRARIDALTRRYAAHRHDLPNLDRDGVLRFGGSWVPLPPVEARLMGALVGRFGAVVSREQLARAGWPEGAPGRNALDVHVLRLRRRISPLGLAIKTVRSRGYLLESDLPVGHDTRPNGSSETGQQAVRAGDLHAGRLRPGRGRAHPGQERRQHHDEEPDGLQRRRARLRPRRLRHRLRVPRQRLHRHRGLLPQPLVVRPRVGLNLTLPTFFFFQVAFAATAATIVSGAMAERTKFKSYFIYSIVITALIYPIVVRWTWGGGWLAQLDTPFSRLRRLHHRAHATGGWAPSWAPSSSGPASASTARTASPGRSPATHPVRGHRRVHPLHRLVRLQPGLELAADDVRAGDRRQDAAGRCRRCRRGHARELAHRRASPTSPWPATACSPAWCITAPVAAVSNWGAVSSAPSAAPSWCSR